MIDHRRLTLPAGRSKFRSLVAVGRAAAARWTEVAVVTVAVVAAAWVATLLFRRFEGLGSAGYDLGFFQQVVWNLRTSGTWVSSFQPGSFLGLHFSPILVVPAAIEAALDADARVLIGLHAAAVGALVPATFLFLRASLRPSPLAGAVAAGIAMGIPVWAATQWVIRSDFHPELAGVVLALTAGWAGLSGRPRTMWILAALALLTREDVAYAVATVALVVAVRGPRRMRIHGRALLVMSIVAGLLVFGLVMPWLRDGLSSETARYYRWLGDGTAILTAPLRIPDRVIAAIARPGPWFVVAGMLIGVAAFPLLRPRWLLLVAPPLGALLLSAHPPQAAIIFQYPVILITPLLVATAMGGRRALAFTSMWRRRRTRHGLVTSAGGSPVRSTRLRPRSPGAVRSAPLVTALILVPAVVCGWAQGSIAPFTQRDSAFLDRPPAVDALREIAAAIPADALLLADEGLVAPLADRTAIRRLTTTRRPTAEAYVILDRAAWSPSRGAAERRAAILEWLPTSGRQVVADDGRFTVWGPRSTVPAP